MLDSLRLHGLQLLCPWEFPGNSTGVDCHFLFQGIFPTQRWNLCLLHCRTLLLNLQGSPLIPLCVLVTQSYPTLCNPIDCSPPGSSVHGILQARILEWVAIPFSTDLSSLGIELWSLVLQADSLLSELPGKPVNSF